MKNYLYKIWCEYDVDQEDMLFNSHADAIEHIKQFHTEEELEYMDHNGLLNIRAVLV
jgi:hypothetical protein